MDQKIYSEKELLKVKKRPSHVAIIMDGNRRWARKNKINILNSHEKGADNLIKILRASIDLNIKVLTVYAFSTENNKRSKNEINALMKLFEIYLKKHANTFEQEGIALKTIGDVSLCPLKLQKLLKDIANKGCVEEKIKLVLAINYGGRDEIARAVKKIIKNKVESKDVSENLIASYLDTFQLPDPDLLIRTSGEFRISNFLLWQMSYSELFITDVYWPDFSKQHLLEAILTYQKRKRRFGNT